MTQQLQGKELKELASKLLAKQLNISVEDATDAVETCLELNEYFDGEPTSPEWLAHQSVSVYFKSKRE